MIQGAALLGNSGRAKLLDFLSAHPNETFSANGLARETGIPLATAWRAARDLWSMGFATMGKEGRQLRIQFNSSSPASAELAHARIPDPYRMAFEAYKARIRSRLPGVKVRLFGSVSRGDHRAGSDVDVLLIYRGSGLRRRQVFDAAIEFAMEVEDQFCVPVVPIVSKDDIGHL